jgi:hypothetical protein
MVFDLSGVFSEVTCSWRPPKRPVWGIWVSGTWSAGRFR